MTATNATLTGAIKTVIEGLGLGVQVFRDIAPPKAHLPYVVVTERVSYQVLPHGDTDATDELAIREQCQLDVWQPLRSSTGARVEAYDLADKIVLAMMTTRLPTWTNHVHGVRVLSATSGLSDSNTLRRDIITAEVDRVLAARA